MKSSTLFASPAQGLGALPAFATVVNVLDPDGLNRVQVQIFNATGVTGQNYLVWARVAVPFAGAKRGAFLFPDVGDEVFVMFAQGDPRYPVVVGGLWNGHDSAPDSFGGGGGAVDRWVFVGKAGTKIAIVEAADGSPQINLVTPSGVNGTLTDDGGGKISLTTPTGTSITLDPSGVTINTTGAVNITASSMEIDSGSVTVNAAMTTFNGAVQCTTLIATALVSSPTYTPGAGNIW